MSDEPLSRPEDWTRYLQNYTLTSFGRIFPDNYDGAIRQFWLQRAEAVDVADIVDIGCGNGALCWILDEHLNRPELRARITGVDFADIDPFGVLQRDPQAYPGLRFISNTPAEQLPFPDASIDLAVSQYGIEYTDLSRSIPEVARVLKPGGHMAFIMHDTQSEVVRLGTQYLDEMQAVLGLGIDKLALRLFDLGFELQTPEQRQTSAEFRGLVEKLNTLTDQVRRIVHNADKTSQVHRFMNRIMSVFADPASASDPGNRQVLIEAGAKLESHVSRIAHLREVALDDAARSKLVELIESVQCTVSSVETFEYSAGLPIGTALVAERT
jgi:SAM-dependent methyltransferase